MTADELDSVVRAARTYCGVDFARPKRGLRVAIVALADQNAELRRTVNVLEARIAACNENNAILVRARVGARCGHGRIEALCDDCVAP